MSLSLHTIKPNKGATKRRKRVGRGNASGHGTYSGRGLKGQKSRSGVSNLKRLGMKQVLLRTPKRKGFKSLKPKDQVVNLIQINKYFKDGDQISPKTLLKHGLIDRIKIPVKILGNGELALKNVEFVGVKMSESVKGKTGVGEEKTHLRQGYGGQAKKSSSVAVPAGGQEAMASKQESKKAK